MLLMNSSFHPHYTNRHGWQRPVSACKTKVKYLQPYRHQPLQTRAAYWVSKSEMTLNSYSNTFVIYVPWVKLDSTSGCHVMKWPGVAHCDGPCGEVGLMWGHSAGWVLQQSTVGLEGNVDVLGPRGGAVRAAPSSWQIACPYGYQQQTFLRPSSPFPHDWFSIPAHQGVMGSLGIWMDGGPAAANSSCGRTTHLSRGALDPVWRPHTTPDKSTLLLWRS